MMTREEKIRYVLDMICLLDRILWCMIYTIVGIPILLGIILR